MHIYIRKRTFGILLFELLIFLYCIPSIKISIFGYTDELLCLISLLWLIYHFIINHYKISKEDNRIMICLLLLIILGLIGNLANNLQNNWFPVSIDIISTIKIITVFIALINYLTLEDSKYIVNKLLPISKIYLWIASIFGVASIFINLGMGGEARYGIRAYNFIFGHAHVQAIMSMTAILYIFAAKDKHETLYLILTCLLQLLTTKGPSIIWVPIIILFLLYYARNRKMHAWMIIVIIAIGVFLGGYQIQNYFLNSNAPRALFRLNHFSYGIWGSGPPQPGLSQRA